MDYPMILSLLIDNIDKNKIEMTFIKIFVKHIKI